MSNPVQAKSGGEMWIFDSVTEINEFVDQRSFMFRGKEFTFGEENKGSEIETYEQVIERCNREWAEGIYIFQQFVDRLKDAVLPELKDKKRRVRFGTEGDDIDFDKLRSGDANFWRSSTREDAHGPTTMTVVIDTTTPWFQNSDDILWRGAAAVALAKILEEKGWSVEIWVVNGSCLYAGKDTPVYTACRLKKTSDPLDISTLINTVSGWFYRTATFTLLETICCRTGNELAYGFGHCMTPTADDLDLLTPDEYRVYSSGVFSFDGALEIIQKQIDEIKNNATEETV